MATLSDPGDTGGRLIAASKVNGTSVYNTAGDKLGSIYDVMLDKHSGKTDYAVMSFGGFLGMGEKYHPLPWNQLKYSEDHGGYVVHLDRAALEGAPYYDTSDTSTWGGDTWRGRTDDYYKAWPNEDLAGTGIGSPAIPPRF